MHKLAGLTAGNRLPLWLESEAGVTERFSGEAETSPSVCVCLTSHLSLSAALTVLYRENWARPGS